MRLIDADNLKIPNDAPYKASVKRVVAMQPTVEAKPVVHGEWLERDWFPFNLYCSVCGKEDAPSDFCSNCGADMRGEKRE